MLWLQISDNICISMNLLQLFFSQQSSTFPLLTNFPLAESIHVWQLSLDGLQNQGFLKIFEVLWWIVIYIKFYQKFLKNSKMFRNSKYMKFFRNFDRCVSNHFLQKRADNLFPTFSRKGIFLEYFFFLHLPNGSTAYKIWLKLYIVKDIT